MELEALSPVPLTEPALPRAPAVYSEQSLRLLRGISPGSPGAHMQSHRSRKEDTQRDTPRTPCDEGPLGPKRLGEAGGTLPAPPEGAQSCRRLELSPQARSGSVSRDVCCVEPLSAS